MEVSLLIDKDEFNKRLFEELVKHMPELTLQDVVDLDFQKDKEAIGGSYWIHHEKVFFALVDKVLCIPTDFMDSTRDCRYGDGELMTVHAQGYALWERDQKTNEFLMGYLGFKHVDTALFGKDRVDLEEFKEIEAHLNGGKLNAGHELDHFQTKYESMKVDLTERGLINGNAAR